MGDFFNGTISNQIYFVYGMIGIVLFLIVALLVVDHKDKKQSSRKAIKKKSRKEEDLELEETLDFLVEEQPKEVELIEEKVEQEPVVQMEEVSSIPSLVEQEEIPLEKEMEVEPVSSHQEEIEEVPTPAKEEIVYVEDDPELEKTQAQLELQRITEELEKASQEEQAIDLTNFELEQEENAIISMDELLKKGDELYNKNEEIQYMDEGTEPINIEELQQQAKRVEQPIVVEEELSSSPVEEMIETVSPQTMKMADFLEPEEQKELENVRDTKFKSTPFISPVFGLQPERAVSPEPIKIEEVEPLVQPSLTVIEPVVEAPVSIPHPDQIALEQTANLEKFDEEIRKTNEFLRQLKELQKNLQ